MRTYIKEKEVDKYFTEYDSTKYYGVQSTLTKAKYVLIQNEYQSGKFRAVTLEPTGNSHASTFEKPFENYLQTNKVNIYEFDTRNELLQWLLD